MPAALALHEQLGASPHLVHRHQLSGEAAAELVHGLTRFADHFDTHDVLIGAALHDAGKVLHPGEMSGPGSLHEVDGERLLREHGLGGLARFSRTHGAWRGEGVALEDLLVTLADKLWKGRRDGELEHRIVEVLADVGGEGFWDVFLIGDDVFEGLAAGGDERLARSVV